MTNVEAGTYEVRRGKIPTLQWANPKVLTSSLTGKERYLYLWKFNYMLIWCTNLQVVANYFGVNGTFQLLPDFNTDHFTLRGRHKATTEMPDKSCKCTLLVIQTSDIWLGIGVMCTVCVMVCKMSVCFNQIGGLGVSALTGVIVGAVLGTAMLIAFYFFR